MQVAAESDEPPIKLLRESRKEVGLFRFFGLALCSITFGYSCDDNLLVCVMFDST